MWFKFIFGYLIHYFINLFVHKLYVFALNDGVVRHLGILLLFLDILCIFISLSNVPPSSMYKPPYPVQNFHFVPTFPSQDPQRPVGPAPLPPPPGSEIQQAPNRPPAPSYGLITDLPLPVPMADSQVLHLSTPSPSPSRHIPRTRSTLRQSSLH